MIADDIVLAGPVPHPLGKRKFIGLQSTLMRALPDWKFNATDFKETGDQVSAMVQITGTHTGELELPMPGMPKIPPTGKKVALPREPITFTVKRCLASRPETLQAVARPAFYLNSACKYQGCKTLR